MNRRSDMVMVGADRFVRRLPPVTIDGRSYFDSWTTSRGMLISSPGCEHCDGERSRMVREDHLRGWICPECDSSLDEMFEEPAGTQSPAGRS